MSAEKMHPASLLHAQRRIDRLRAELDQTLESAERLTRIGHPELALRLVNEQRSSLERFVKQVAQDVAPQQRSYLRRRITAVVAAASIAVMTFASLGMAHSDRPELVTAAGRFVHAGAIDDPAARLRELIAIYERTSKLRGGAVLSAHVADAARHTRDDLVQNDDGSNEDLIAQADRMINDATRPPTPPSSDQSPLDPIHDAIAPR